MPNRLSKCNRIFMLLIIGALISNNVFANGRCVQVDRVIVQGVSKRLIKPVLKITDKFKEHCLSGQDIQDLMRQLTNYYVSYGYITSRVMLPEQDLTHGELTIDVKEGYIEGIDIKSEYKKPSPFLAVKKGQILSLRDIEQTYDQYNNGHSKDVKISLKPGIKSGATRVVIDKEPGKKWHLVSGIDNSGTKHTDNLQTFSNLTFGNVFGLNESFALNWRSSLADPVDTYSNSKGVRVSVPVGYNDISYSYNLSKDRNPIRSRGNLYINRGGSKSHKADISRLIHRNGTSKTSVSIGLGNDIYNSYLGAHKLDISSYKIAKADFGMNHERKLSGSIFSLGLNVTTGINNGYYTPFGDLGVPEEHFTKINFNSSWLKPVPVVIADRNVQYRMQFSGQYSAQRLVTSEKFSLGGLGSIRGFKEYRENADNALLVRNELIGFLPSIKTAKLKKFIGDVSVFTAFDIGYFCNYEEVGEKRGTMAGIATGIRNSGSIINFSITLARPFQAPLYHRHKNIIYINFAVNI